MDGQRLGAFYSEHLRIQERRWSSLLREAGCAGRGEKIVPTDLSEGFRARMKFKIYRRGGLRAVGTDPRFGERPAADCLWALPGWGRTEVLSVLEAVLREDGEFPVDGVEFLLTHGREGMFALLSVGRGREKSYRGYAAKLVREHPRLSGAAVPSQDFVAGQPYLKHRIPGLDLRAHHKSFFQSNLQLTPRILSFVDSLCRRREGRRLLDLYCGVGLHSLYAGRWFERVWGVEDHPQAVRDARANARAAGKRGPWFFETKVESFAGKYRILPEDCVILNPPRSGIGRDIIRRVAAGEPGGIISVSCNPDTQARDLRLFVERGYSVVESAAFDMFPFSPFLETVVLLEKA